MKENDYEYKKEDISIPLSYERPKRDIESATEGKSTKYTTDESVAKKISESPVDETAVKEWHTGQEPYGTGKPWRKRITAKIEK